MMVQEAKIVALTDDITRVHPKMLVLRTGTSDQTGNSADLDPAVGVVEWKRVHDHGLGGVRPNGPSRRIGNPGVPAYRQPGERRRPIAPAAGRLMVHAFEPASNSLRGLEWRKSPVAETGGASPSAALLVG
jgi:hypothetical protein